MNREHATAPAAMVPTVKTPGPGRIDSQELLRNGRELIIAHQGEEYRLRLTRQDKLILTK